MSVLSILAKLMLTMSLLFFAGCQVTDLAKNSLVTFKNPTGSDVSDGRPLSANSSLISILSIQDVVSQADPKINVDAGFSKAVASAVRSDPKVLMARAEILQRQAKLNLTKSQLDFQFSGTIYAGIEDVTDETNGVAAVLSASKIMYDGGQISNTVAADEYGLQAAFESYRAILDERALDVGTTWVELERYQSLNGLISGRLAVLDPLIKQLEQIADAGVGDATQVAAAERTVAMIRVTQTDVQERLTQAELNFIRLLGELPKSTVFDYNAVDNAVPRKVTEKLATASPGLLSGYASYLSALKSLQVAQGRNNMTVGFETKVQRPFGQSGYDNDESIGFVARKTLHNGNKLSSEILAAKAAVDRQEASVKDLYQRGKQAVDASTQSILFIDKAIGMARSNAQALSDEISLLRKQLVIGQSTLDGVLSAEARLYDAESKEINLMADKRNSQLRVLSAIGRLSTLIGINAALELK
jgi:outer membrane protein TolC